MKLANLLECLEYVVIQGTEEIDIAKVVSHSKDAEKNALFVCISGMHFDGCSYIEEAVGRGAVGIVAEKEVEVPEGMTLIRVQDARSALAKIAAAFYRYPAEELQIVGVTGTKGKTTTACMIYEILQKQPEHKPGLIGTMEIRTGRRRIPATHTSPESLAVQGYLREMADAGCDIVVMEVSSQGLKLHRVDGIRFEIGVFTNLGEDHIGPYEHASMEEYKNSKAKLFRQCSLGILNRDDVCWKEMVRDAKCRVETYGFREQSDYRITGERRKNEQGILGVEYCLNEEMIRLTMPGRFNIYNSAAAYAVCRNLGIDGEKIRNALQNVQVCGRVERVIQGTFTVLIDYAHNAMSLQSVLEMVHSYHPKRIVTIFGCGGGRARSRRYEMGRVAGELSDFTIITSDNPRYEEPLEIMLEIRLGIQKTAGRYIEICDRREAVRFAIQHAEEGDVILLAGKGHEAYQEIKGVRYHLDDHEIVRQAMKE